MKNFDVSKGRKIIYFVGVCITVIGFLLFFSVLARGVMNFGNFENFDVRSRQNGLLAVGGIGLTILGSILKRIGERGLAGAGIILDPRQARKDLEPINRSLGGEVNDTLEEIEIGKHLNRNDNDSKKECTECRYFNDLADKYCGNCGSAI